MRINDRIYAALSALLLMLTMSAGLFAIPAYASDGSEWEEFPAAPSAPPTTVDETPAPPLTPDGNLILVDDVGSASSAGKQFVTFVSKNGNYFYLVIDRDDKGNENVHFLNLVDESDLLSFLEDDAAAAYQQAHAEPQPTPTATPELIADPVEKPEPEKEKSTISPLLILLPLVIAAGGGAAYYLIRQKKKQAAQEKPDPDADYSEDDSDYDYAGENAATEDSGDPLEGNFDLDDSEADYEDNYEDSDTELV